MLLTEAIETSDHLKEQVASLPQNGATRAVLDILDQHVPNSRKVEWPAWGDSDECHEDQGLDGAVHVNWPCETVQAIIDGFDE